MTKHPSLFSMPLSSLPNEPEKKQITVEDQEAKFIFELNSCRQCGYGEFYGLIDSLTP
jgi:predicted nucleic-acid-binding Zn-ribbon protein